MSNAMTEGYAAGAISPNRGGAKTCTVSPKTCTASPLQISITDLIKRKYPSGSKAWAFVAGLFGLKERAAKHRLSNAVSYTIEELQALIQGEDGLEYFEALMADAEPAWWAWARWAIEQGALKRLAVEATQKSLQLESHLPISPARAKGNPDVKKLSAGLSRSQTALGLLDSFSGRAGAGAVVSPQAQTSRAGARR